MIPVSNNGAPEICEIQKIDTKDHKEVSFLFQKRRFIYDEETDTFSPPSFQVDEDNKISVFQKSTGLKDIDYLLRMYGPNKFDIPCQRLLNCSRNTRWHPSLFSKSSVLACGLWMNCGITLCLLCSCWWRLSLL